MSISRGDLPLNVNQNRRLFLDALGVPESGLAQAVQISRDCVRQVETTGEYPDCDAMITSSTKVYLSILTADCTPILIWADHNPVIAAVHSGWQGSELDLLGKTIKMMITDYHVKSDSLNLVIGPGLSREYFEVGPEFRTKFPPAYLKGHQGSGKIFFDHNAYLRESAIRQGVPGHKIEILDYCSYRDEDLFFSHRRDRGITGRMISVIGMSE